MRLTYLVIATAFLGLSGLATAGPGGEETLKLDLTALPEGSTYFVKCSRDRDVANCGLVSVWEQTNGLPGLQTSIFGYGGRPYDPDARLLA